MRGRVRYGIVILAAFGVKEVQHVQGGTEGVRRIPFPEGRDGEDLAVHTTRLQSRDINVPNRRAFTQASTGAIGPHGVSIAREIRA